MKVDDPLTVNNRESRPVGGGGGHPKLTILCIRKGRSTFMAIGNTRLLFNSPTTSLDRMTVNAGAVLLTVSVKLTSMYLSATRPRKTVVNLKQ